MKKVVTFGELMLRLAPENYLRFLQAEKYQATFGGAEANVAVSLANYGVDVAFVSKLPAHEIGQSAVNSLRKFGVDTSTSLAQPSIFFGRLQHRYRTFFLYRFSPYRSQPSD